MGELTSYRLSDFILFSEQTYFRMFELYNQAWWPWHFVVVLLVIEFVYLFWRKPAWAGQMTAIILVVSWCWIAWAFLYQRFYIIHVAANMYALGFVLQAGLIAWHGIYKNRFEFFAASSVVIIIGSILLVVSMIYPLLLLILQRNIWQFELFGFAPDPTAIGTLGLLLLLRAKWWLYILPVIWLLLSLITLLVM